MIDEITYDMHLAAMVEQLKEEEEQANLPEHPIEFMDVYKVLDFGAEKYEPNSWLEMNEKIFNHKSNHDSMFHHLAESYAGEFKDPESDLHPLLHLACRALMEYTRIKRGIRT